MQKPGVTVPAYMRWVNRRLARLPAAVAYRLGMSPNAVTALSGAVSAVGILVIALSPASVASGVIAACALAAGFVLDSADGQLARLRGTGGPAGEWLDHVVDAARTGALHAAVLVGLWRQDAAPAVLAIPLLFGVLVSTQFFSQVLAEQLASGRREAADAPIPPRADAGVARSWAMLPTDPGVMCWLFVLWGVPGAFTIGYAIIGAATLVHAAASMPRKCRGLARQP